MKFAVKSKKSKLLLVCMIIMLLFSFSGCGDEEEYGEISDVVTTDIGKDADGEEISSIFKKQDTDLNYEWDNFDNGRAHIRIPYPAGWSVSMKTEYDVYITAPADDPVFPGMTVCFDSPLEQTAIRASDDLIAFVYEHLTNNIYSFSGINTQIDEDAASADKIVVNTQISDPNRQLQKTWKDWDVITMDGDPDRYYRQITGFYWYNYPCTLSALCPNEKADKLNDLLTYMFTNSVYINNSLGKTENVTLFEDSGFTIPMSPIYEQKTSEVDDLFSNAVTFYCPIGTGTGYSQSYLSIYEAPTTVVDISSKNFEKKYLPLFIRNTLEKTPKDLDLQGYMVADDGSVTFSGNKTQEFVYWFQPSYYNSGLPEGCYKYQAWKMLVYPIMHGDITDVVVLVCPHDSLSNAFELIEHMTVELEYK